jgi:hypothetical protein
MCSATAAFINARSVHVLDHLRVVYIQRSENEGSVVTV